MSSQSLSVLLSAAALLASAACVSATPALPEDGPISAYALHARDLRDFHGGVHGSFATRNVRSHGFESEMDANRVNAYLGYDLTRSLTIYALGGVLSVEDEDDGLEEDTSSVWGLGLWATLVDDDEFAYLPTISRYRLNSGLEYSYADPNDLGWSQFDAFLTFEIVNDNLINNEFFPASVSVFAGPVFTSVDLDGYKQISDNNWGFTVGGALTFGPGVFVNGGCDFFNDDSCGYFTAGVCF